MTPLFTIITACYNSEKTIEKTLNSILNQDFNNFEYIIVDGFSHDKTVEIIKIYESKFKEKKINFKWISEKDTGIYDAWNKGIHLSSGIWISFIGADDIYMEGSLKKYESYAISNPEVDFIHSNVMVVNNGKKIRSIHKNWQWNKFRRYMEIAHVGAFHRSNYFKHYGVFNTSYRIAGDYELLLRSKSKLKSIYFDSFTAQMEDGGVSNKFITKAFKEAMHAKIHSGKVPYIYAKIDFYLSYFKYFGGKLKKYVKFD